MPEESKPVVVISKCLGIAPCRYNGEMITDSFVQKLVPHVTFIPVCPEVEIGLGVPRHPIRLVTIQGETHLIQPITGQDLSAPMQAFSRDFLSTLDEVDGFILKSRSPSCGLRDSKRYPTVERGAAVGKGAGIFAAQVLERFGELAVEDEKRLSNLRIREHFLTKLFTLARFRMVKRAGTMGALVRFHTTHKLLLMAYNQKEMRLLGRIVANAEKSPFSEVIAAYDTHLKRALTRLPRRTSPVNVCMHALGYVSPRLSAREKRFFLHLLERYRQEQVPLRAALSVLQSWILRFEEAYLQEQFFFSPYPEALVDLHDSGKDLIPATIDAPPHGESSP